MTLYTPLGEVVTIDDDCGLVECPYCHFAVLEDEAGSCPGCENFVCLYCYQEGVCCDGDEPRPDTEGR